MGEPTTAYCKDRTTKPLVWEREREGEDGAWVTSRQITVLICVFFGLHSGTDWTFCFNLAEQLVEESIVCYLKKL